MSSFIEWADKARRDRELRYKDIYGEIKPKIDKRDFRIEAIEELIDALNYVDWAYEKGELSLGEWKQIEVHVKLALSYIPNGKRLYTNSLKSIKPKRTR